MSGGGKKITVGYRYYMGLHMGSGVGPYDEFVEFEVGGRTAWFGSVSSTTQIYIDNPELFGGDQGEGGIQGTLDVMMGAPDQVASAKLTAMQGGVSPGFRGMATLFYDGLISAMNPYPKPWRLRHRRTTAGWEDNSVWYPTKAVIWLADGAIKAMNPAHIIYQCLTDTRWAGGIPPTLIDQDAFAAAADTLYDEGFGLCVRWNRQDGVHSFIALIQNHIGANLFIDRATGKVVLRLVRNDYDVNLIPSFDPDTGLIDILEDEAAALSTNELIINYTDPIKGEKRQVRGQNIGSIQSSAGIISETRDYLGIPIGSLALRVAQRDLNAMQVPRRYKVVLDRRGSKIEPGGVFKISHPQRGIANVVLRAGRIEDGTLTDGRMTFTAVLDVFGLPATSFIGVQEPSWTPPSLVPAPVATQEAFEAPYRELTTRLNSDELAALGVDSAYVAAMALAPSDMAKGYAMMTKVGAAPYVEQSRASWIPFGVTSASIPLAHAPVAVTFSVFLDLDFVDIGSAAIVDGEIMRVVAVNPTAGTATLARGCADTVPAEHISGSTVWFYDGFTAEDPTEYFTGETVDIKLLTYTGGGILAEGDATAMSVAVDQRATRPYPPGKVLVNGVENPIAAESGISAIWAHRDRIAQYDQLVDTETGDMGPEAGTTYSLVIKRADTMAIIEQEVGIVGTSSSTLFPVYSGDIIVELFSVRDGLDSWQKHTYALEYLGSEVRLLESGEERITESGELRVLEA